MQSLLRTQSWALGLVLCAPAFAQQAMDADAAPATPGAGGLTPVAQGPQFLAPLGTLVGGPYDVQTPVGDTGCLGVARAWGHYWVSARQLPAPGSIHEIHKYDLTGAYVATYPTGGTASTSAWGLRDLAVDEANNKLYGGFEGAKLQEYTYNPGTGALAFTAEYVVQGLATSVTIRALARNPNNGNFFTRNFNSSTYEIAFSAGVYSVVNTFPTTTKATYGLAWEPVNDVLWCFDQFPVSTTDAVEFNEMDPTTGALNPRTFVGTLYAVTGTNIAGGCDIFDDGSGTLKIVGLHQNTADELNIYDLDVATTPPPTAYCTGGTTTNGCVASMSATGTPSAAATSGFTLTCSNVEGQKQGIQFYGFVQLIQPWAVGSTSFLCIKAPTQRMINQNAGGNINQCDGVISTDFLAFVAANPTALGAPFSAGNMVNAQTWFRDPPAVKTTNLSNALQWTMVP